MLDTALAVRRSLARKFISSMYQVAQKHGVGDDVTGPYSALLKYMWEYEYRGACHSTSAVLYMLLREFGNKPHLCIGEIRAGKPTFDHSWVELNGLIYDVAISLPDKSGAPVGGPLFASVDLYSSKTCEHHFGISNGTGLDDKALVAHDNTLADYVSAYKGLDVHNDEEPDIWDICASLMATLGRGITPAGLVEKYGAIRREYRRDCLTSA